MHRTVGRQPRQPIGQFKARVAQGAIRTQSRSAQRRFMNQVQRQARVQSILIGRFPRPNPQDIPGSQAQVFGHEQPQPEQIARDFISQELPDLSFHAAGVGWFQADSFCGALRWQERRGVFWVQRVEFFFARRNRR